MCRYLMQNLLSHLPMHNFLLYLLVLKNQIFSRFRIVKIAENYAEIGRLVNGGIFSTGFVCSEIFAVSKYCKSARKSKTYFLK